MKKVRFAVVKAAAAVLVLCVCGVCIWEKLSSMTPEDGERLLLYAAGMAPGEPVPEPSPQVSEPLETVKPFLDGMSIFEADGILPFHADELPALSVTPEPGRAVGEVSETQISGGAKVADFFVKDTSSSGLDLSEELSMEPDVNIYADGRPEVLLYHTHTSEAYMDSFTGFYYTDMNTRTENREKSVVAAGVEMKRVLEENGIGVIHDMTVNDTMYNGSYSRSWEVIQKNLSEYPDIQVTVDIHRDSMTTDEGLKYKPTTVIENRRAAQFMIITGCDAAGLWGDFPSWRENLHLALRVQQEAQRLYPGLARPLNFSDSKYNMNATTGSLLVEVGTEVNTVSEAKYTGRLFGEILANVLLKTKTE